MPAGYLITVLLLATGTVCALWPSGSTVTEPAGRRHVPWRVPVFLIGMSFNEAPVFPLLVAVSASALAVGEGRLSGPAGAAGLAGMFFVAVGLLLAAAQSARNRTALSSTLEQRLPGFFRSAGPWRRARRGYRVVLAGFFLPLQRRRRDVRRISNVHYGPDGRHTLDLYLPRRQPATRGVFIHFHGGRFASGGKNRESLYLLYRLAARGWACVSANYRLAPAARFPDYVLDAKRVVAWARREGPAHDAGGGPVIVAGNSAGAFLAAFCALTPNHSNLQPGFEAADTSVDAAVCQYGYYGRVLEATPWSTPEAHITPEAPPFFILHGDRDSIVPVRHGGNFARALERVSDRPVVWCRLPGAQHAFDYFASICSRLAAGAIEDFASWVRGQYRPDS